METAFQSLFCSDVFSQFSLSSVHTENTISTISIIPSNMNNNIVVEEVGKTAQEGREDCVLTRLHFWMQLFPFNIRRAIVLIAALMKMKTIVFHQIYF